MQSHWSDLAAVDQICGKSKINNFIKKLSNLWFVLLSHCTDVDQTVYTCHFLQLVWGQCRLKCVVTRKKKSISSFPLTAILLWMSLRDSDMTLLCYKGLTYKTGLDDLHPVPYPYNWRERGRMWISCWIADGVWTNWSFQLVSNASVTKISLIKAATD